jgi:DNA recombination protein RmuC
MEPLLYLVFLVLGVCLGGGTVWLLVRQNAEHVRTRALAQAEAERAALQERLAARQQEMERLRTDYSGLEQRLRAAQQAEADLRVRIGQLSTQIEQERKQAAEKLAVLDDARQKLSDAFKALASDALQSSSRSFLELAKATLEKFQEAAKGDLEKRQQAIGELVKPVKESLEKVDAKILELEKARVGAYEALRQQVGALLDSQRMLQTETARLVQALRKPQVRGRWGEIQLQRVVELAGMQEYCDFFQQQSADSEDSRLRPDLLVRLPGGKTIVVDAKVPLTAYLEAVEAVDEPQRAEHLRAHAQQVRSHIDSLGRKSYFDQFDPSPEFVVLFLPGEVFFSAAVAQDPGLIEWATERRVIPASPTTLIALLKAVAYGWQQQRLAENAAQIQKLGQELYKRIADMADHWAKLGDALRKATEAYNKAVGTLESRVLVSARRFAELGVPTSKDKEIALAADVDVTPRQLQAPEMCGGRRDKGPTAEQGA